MNAKHDVAVAARAERITQLRADIHAQLGVLLELHGYLQDLTGTRQAVGIGFMSPQARELADRQAAADRAAARGLVGRVTGLGLAWLNRTDIGLGAGQTPAPVTIPAASADAELLFTLRHHVHRLGRPALAALHTLRSHTITADETAGACTLPPSPAYTSTLLTDPPTTAGDIDDLAADLGRLVDLCTSRKALEAVLRDLEHLDRISSDVVHGGKTPHPDPCPWCGRKSLAIWPRRPGRDDLTIRCEGNHRCVCDDPWCGCHRGPTTGRHEWVNSSGAANPIDGRSPHSLTSLIAHRKELAMLETRALDALEQIRALHQPHWVDPDGRSHAYYAVVSEPPADHACVIDGSEHCYPDGGEHLVPACVECRQANQDGDPIALLWPCPTYQAADLDTTDTSDEQESRSR